MSAAIVISWFIASGAFDGAFSGSDQVIGTVKFHQVRANESLIEIARRYDLGFNSIAAANPHVDPFVPSGGTTVVVPTKFIVPSLVAPGTIVVNLSEMRLYYTFTDLKQRFTDHNQGTGTLVTAPIGIGVEGTGPPLGTYRVIQKEVHPYWHPPPSIRKERPELPWSIPPGPDNPLGTHALRLSSPHILIHGTNKPYGVGRHVSHGCIRLYPEDILWLYDLVPVGTKVVVVREPVKVGLSDNHVYVEVHADADLDRNYNSVLARQLLSARSLAGRVDPTKLNAVLRDRSGLPVDVTRQEAVAGR